MREGVGHQIGDVRPHPEDRRVFPCGVDTVREQNDEQVAVGIHPERGTRIARVAEGAP